MPDLQPGVAGALSPLVRRIVAANPTVMTGPGTNTYLVGIDEVAVIDPGPDDAGHIESIVGASMRERVRWVLLTHSHPDHCAGAARLVAETGAEVVGWAGAPYGVPVDRPVTDGEVIEGTEWGLVALHTPGHSSDHLCFFLEEERVLLTGDLILGGMTPVIPPPDGDMIAYLASLERLRKRRLSRLCPGHGDVIDDARGTIERTIAHRHQREAQILEALDDGPASVADLVARIYVDVAVVLHPMAGRTVYAHLLKLQFEGRASGSDASSPWKRTT